jgi:hypothetical protein
MMWKTIAKISAKDGECKSYSNINFSVVRNAKNDEWCWNLSCDRDSVVGR